jgi:DNA-binding transcriptional ArsR family regulator/rhodanese-related sulfurtransferase
VTKPLSTKRSFETPAVRGARETLLVEAAHLAGMTAAPVRIAILGLLAQGERNVEAIADAVGQSLANTSQHLRKLASARLVVVQKKGVHRAYALASPEVHLFVGALQALTAALSPVARTKEDALVPEALRSPLTLAAVLPAVRAGKAILLDVRQPEESAAVPLAEAMRVPISGESDLASARSALENKGTQLPVYVFCRGRYCVTASKTAAFLRGAGHDAWCLRETALDAMAAQKNTSI